MPRPLAFGCSVLFALMFSFAPVLADEVDIDGQKISFDPAQIRYITPSSYIVSSCIGDLRTPSCALQTLIGCGNYVWNPACSPMNQDVYRPENIRVEFVILKAGFVNRAKVAEILKTDRSPVPHDEEPDFGVYPWLTPDAFQAKAIERSCPAEWISCEGAPWMATIYTISPHQGIWTFSMYGVFEKRDWFVD